MLQDRVRPAARDGIAELLEEELAMPLPDVFPGFDWHPVAAASIGQVYRARLHDGSEVAVKVQYPGVAGAVRADMQNLGLILRLMKRLQEEHQMAIVMITHDLGVVAELADDVIVMYGGKVVEQAHVSDLFAKPEMPYTWGLLGSLPRLNSTGTRLDQIPGQPPSLLNPPSGCPFHPRCEFVMNVCRQELPPLELSAVGEEHRFRCHLDEEARARIWNQKRAALVGENAA